MNADFVPAGSVVADVGCDHGYVSIYLAEKKKCRCIAMDVRRGPLEIAEKNIKKFHLESMVECRLSDGLHNLMPGEVDTLVIGGMGGMLMSRILSEKPDVLQDVSNLVLQPQSDWKEVRRTVHKSGFYIKKEACVLDGGKFYLAIQAVRGEEIELYNDAEYCFGRYLSHMRDMCFLEYLKGEKKTCETILQSLAGKTGESVKVREQELMQRLEWMEELL